MSDLFPNSSESTIRGIVRGIRFRRDDFCILSIDVTHSADPSHAAEKFAAVGSMVIPMLGQEYEFYGAVSKNDKYKTLEIRFSGYRTIVQNTDDGIARYLAQFGKWIGPAHARSIIKLFGKDSIETIKSDPNRLTAISGLTTEKIAELRASILANESGEAAMIELYQTIGNAVPQSVARKAITKWGSEAASIIKQNPFRLTEFRGVGFLTADAVWMQLGLPPNSIDRHVAALQYAADEITQNEGHTVLTVDAVSFAAARLIGNVISDEARVEFLSTMQIEDFREGFSLPEYGQAESFVAGKLIALNVSDHEVINIDRDSLGDDQSMAVGKFCYMAEWNSPCTHGKNAFILCGAPGTGKTYTIARIIKTYAAKGKSIALCAPTGKAAKQMERALGNGHIASTIHSLLQPEIDEESGEFRFSRDESHPIEADLIVIDEFSMIDIKLCRSLFRAIAPGTRVLIVGDHYQLPSVGPGAVLRDMIAADVPHYELREIKRNAGRIVRACHSIKDGELPEPSEQLDLAAGENWRHFDAAESECKPIIEALLRDHLPRLDIDPFWNCQIISPVNSMGELSCKTLNVVAKNVLNIGYHDGDFSVNDKIVRTKNAAIEGVSGEWHGGRIDRTKDDKVRVVNGDLGIIKSIGDKLCVQFRYPDRIAYLPLGEHHLKLAYCLTCHKMQGSEVDVVILPLYRSLMKLPMVTREWLYTAFSRAKKFIITIGDLDSAKIAIRKVGNGQRRTLLCQKIKAATTSKCSMNSANTMATEASVD